VFFSNEFCGRFNFVLDMNADGMVTISDVWMLFKSVFLIPSKVITAGVAQYPTVASFFEIDCFTGEGAGGAIFSIAVWFVVLVLFVSAFEK